MLINNLFECTQEEFNLTKSRSKIILICSYCKQKYTRSKKEVLDTFKITGNHPKFCSKLCLAKQREQKIKTNCVNCNIEVIKSPSQYKKTKNHFCSQSCAATYSNKNKKTGTRRSKFEKYLEKTLNNLFPNLVILYSNKTIIQSELDVYIPSLKLAFEIQGIFHYEPIYGQEKLVQIQKNDLEKIEKCKELGIKLIQIDISKQQNFKEETSLVYLQQIINYIK